MSILGDVDGVARGEVVVEVESVLVCNDRDDAGDENSPERHCFLSLSGSLRLSISRKGKYKSCSVTCCGRATASFEAADLFDKSQDQVKCTWKKKKKNLDVVPVFWNYFAPFAAEWVGAIPASSL